MEFRIEQRVYEDGSSYYQVQHKIMGLFWADLYSVHDELLCCDNLEQARKMLREYLQVQSAMKLKEIKWHKV